MERQYQPSSSPALSAATTAASLSYNNNKNNMHSVAHNPDHDTMQSYMCLNKDCSPLHHWNGCINASGVESSPNWTRSLFTNKPPPKMVDGDKSA